MSTLGTVHITYIGEISFLKGIHYLVDAVRYLVKDVPGLKVRLIGGGSAMTEMKQFVSYFGLENVIEFVGYIKNNNIPNYLSSTKVYVQPSLTEVWSNSTIEALAMGVPVICSRIEGLIELIDHGKYGELCNTADSKDLYEKLRLCFTDPTFYNDLQSRAHAASSVIKKRYTLMHQVSAMEDLYKEMLSNKRS